LLSSKSLSPSPTMRTTLISRHHLHSTRPLPQPPLCDLLPPAYLSSLRRTEARVRFAESHPSPESADTGNSRPGLRRRPTGPKSDTDGDGENEWELSDLRTKAEEAVEKLSQAVGNVGQEMDMELRQQLHQLNIPSNDESSKSRTTTSTSGSGKRKSNLYSPYPPNMPLALLKLMESYVVGLAEVPREKGGWAEAKRERGLTLIKSLCTHLGDAERLSSSKSFLVRDGSGY
jgi:putative membrane protein